MISPELQKLHDAVQKNTNANASAVQAFKGIADQILAAKEDPEEVARLADALNASADALAAAIPASTSSTPQADPTKSSSTIPSVSSITPNTPKPAHPSPDPSASATSSDASAPTPTGNDGVSGPDAAVNKTANASDPDASSNR